VPGDGAYAFTDPDEYEASVRDARIELVVTGRGQFRATLTRAEFSQLHLSRSREVLASITYVALKPDLVFVAFPTRFDPPPIWGGRQLQPGEIVFHGLGDRMHQRTAGSSCKGLIALKPEDLAQWSRVLAEDEIATPTIARIVRPSRSSASRLLYLHASACGLVESSPAAIAHPEIGRALEQELIRTLIACLRPDDRPPARLFRERGRAVMSRFEDVIAAHRDRPLHMPELCRAIAVSERTLRHYCAEFLGVSPSRYLRLQRLKMVRTELQKADSATTSVAAVVRRHGFGEPGRFASLYRSVYGETPSATLRLRRRESPAE
jgi:AraC-like DNA-binding protein